jgi:hypothetical protein
MRYYLIDEITPKDMELISGFLRENAVASGLDNVFWVNLPEDGLNKTQKDHADCRPYCFALEIGKGLIKAELFIRTLRGFNCACSGFCDEMQRRYIMEFMDGMMKKIGVKA